MNLRWIAVGLGAGMTLGFLTLPPTQEVIATVAPSLPDLPQLSTPGIVPPKVEPPPAPKLVHPSRETVIRAVGHSEGNMDAKGNITSAYYGHTDPGNHVANIGAFSYQKHQIGSHQAIARNLPQCAGITTPGALTPDCANAIQFVRLEHAWQSNVVDPPNDRSYVDEYKDVQEIINFYDLNTQSPRASADLGWWLNHHRSQGLRGRTLIVNARVDSYCEVRQPGCRISARGFGNSRARLTDDQARRVNAIHRALSEIEKSQ